MFKKKVQIPHKDKTVGTWLTPESNNDTIKGLLYSAAGNRVGETFQGMCMQGDGIATIDCSSFVGGTMTVKAWWVKDASNNVHVDSCLWHEIDVLAEPRIDLTTEVSGTTITLQNNYKYYGLHIYDDGDLVAILIGEEATGTALYDVLNLHTASLTNAIGFFVTDIDVPYSWRNNKGYTEDSEVYYLSSVNLDVTANNSTLDQRGKVKQTIQLVEAPCLVGDNVWCLRLPVAVTSVKIEGVDIIGDYTLVNVSGIPRDIRFHAGVKVYDLLVNDTYYFSVAEGKNAYLVGDDLSTNTKLNIDIINGTYPTIWSTQDAFHYTAAKGLWKNETELIAANGWYKVCEIDNVGITSVVISQYSGYILEQNGRVLGVRNDTGANANSSTGIRRDFDTSDVDISEGLINVWVNVKNTVDGATTNWTANIIGELDLTPYNGAVWSRIQAISKPNFTSIKIPNNLTINQDSNLACRLQNNAFDNNVFTELNKVIDLKFINLGQNNNITSADLTPYSFSALKWLNLTRCSSLAYVNISNLANLKTLQVKDTPALGTDIILGNVALEVLTCSSYDIDISNLTSSLVNYECNANTLELLDMSSFTELERINIGAGGANSNTSQLITTNLTKLTTLLTSNSHRGIFDISTNIELIELVVSGSTSVGHIPSISKALIDLDNNGKENGSFIYGTVIPQRTLNSTDDVLDAYNNLISKGWTLSGIPA
jgi:hypothetical protein